MKLFDSLRLWLVAAVSCVALGVGAAEINAGDDVQAPVKCAVEINFTSEEPVMPGKTKSVVVKRGQTVCIQAMVHGSVGMDFEMESDSRFFKVSEETKYLGVNPDAPGGDRAMRTVWLKATRRGTTKIVCKEIMRGDVVKEIVYKVVVK